MKKNAFYPYLDPDAPEVPKGLKPRAGVEYGCGDKACRACYVVIPRGELRPLDCRKGGAMTILARLVVAAGCAWWIGQQVLAQWQDIAARLP